MTRVETVLGALERAHVRYALVGGLAVVLRGHLRATADIDLLVGLEPDNALAAIGALTALGLRPRAPVTPESFADPAIRTRWIEDKGMRVFSLWDPTEPLLEVDLFVEPPPDLEGILARTTRERLLGMEVSVATVADLIALKRLAGRPQDLADIAALEALAHG
jgi:hypothetical protein